LTSRVIAVPVSELAPAELVLAWRCGEAAGLLDHVISTCAGVVAAQPA
jgi:hypothetical protein